MVRNDRNLENEARRMCQTPAIPPSFLPFSHLNTHVPVLSCIHRLFFLISENARSEQKKHQRCRLGVFVRILCVFLRMKNGFKEKPLRTYTQTFASFSYSGLLAIHLDGNSDTRSTSGWRKYVYDDLVFQKISVVVSRLVKVEPQRFTQKKILKFTKFQLIKTLKNVYKFTLDTLRIFYYQFYPQSVYVIIPEILFIRWIKVKAGKS